MQKFHLGILSALVVVVIGSAQISYCSKLWENVQELRSMHCLFVSEAKIKSSYGSFKFLMKRKKGKISIVEVNFYSFMQPYTNNLLFYFFHFTQYCASSNYIQTITKASVAKKLVRKIIFWAVPPGHGGGKKE